jgi:FkbM family methyltransferase
VIRYLLTVGFRLNIVGIGHLARFLYRKESAPYLRTQLKGGRSLFKADFRQHTDQIILRTGEYETEVSAALSENLRPNEVFWDIGANTGYHSVLIKSLIPSIEVVSFEPNPEVFLRLVENQRLNGVGGRLLPIALGIEVGVQRLHVVDNGNSGLTTSKPSSLINYDSQLEVLTLTGDFAVENFLAPFPDTIKIDVEGSELDVLRGMPGILQNNPPHTIIFEALNPSSLGEIQKLLESFNFSTPVPIDDSHNFISKFYRAR